VEARGDLAADEKATIALFKAASPSVVFITTLARRGGGFFDMSETPQGAGSGFIWDKEGHVVTNYHVILEADSARVTLADQSTLPATLVGADPDKDLAVLKITADPSKLPPLTIGTSRNLEVGQKTFAIGNPFGLDQTLTTGVVSALQRRLPTSEGREIADVIQTDAAINPGNSGGPLLDSAGRLIGVNTAIFSPSGASAGIGFSIPVDVVNRVVPQLVANGRMPTPGIGVIAAQEAAARLGIEGVVVVRTLPGSPAQRAGLRGVDPQTGQIGDIIVGVNGKPVRRLSDLIQALEQTGVGQSVEIAVERQGRTVTVPVNVADTGRALQ